MLDWKHDMITQYNVTSLEQKIDKVFYFLQICFLDWNGRQSNYAIFVFCSGI